MHLCTYTLWELGHEPQSPFESPISVANTARRSDQVDRVKEAGWLHPASLILHTGTRDTPIYYKHAYTISGHYPIWRPQGTAGLHMRILRRNCSLETTRQKIGGFSEASLMSNPENVRIHARGVFLLIRTEIRVRSSFRHSLCSILLL